MSDFPYPGLRPFKREETDIFFGRDEISNQLIERLGYKHFLVVVGVSGCGKSSLVRTGMLAGLERGLLASGGIHWRVAELRPSNDPFARLADALLADSALKPEYTEHFVDDSNAAALLEADLRRGPFSLHEILQDSPLPLHTNLLLIVDQFEEIFRYRPHEAAAFVRLLLEGSQHPVVYVVITMRSDFIKDCASFTGLPETINEGLFFTPALTREQLQEAIEGPAKIFGDQVEPTLTNHLINEMKGDLNQLPVLQHVLMRMWNLAKAEQPAQPAVLTLKHYEAIGGLAGALSQHANKAYQELAQLEVPAHAQAVAEILFRRLGKRDLEGRYIRDPAKLNEIAELAQLSSWQQMVPVIEVFRQAGRHFLMPPLEVELKPESVIDISHESLIEHCHQLKGWIKAEAESADIYHRLENNACLWQEKRAGLLSEIELEITSNWFRQKQPTAIWAKRYGKHFDLAKHFLETSEAEQQRIQQEKQATRQKQWQQEWQLKQARKIIFGVVIGLIVALVLAAWGHVERNRALAEKQKAKVAQAEAIHEKQKREVELFDSHLTHATLLTRDNDYASAKNILEKTQILDSKVGAEYRHTRNLLAWFSKLMGAGPKQIYQDAGAPLFAVAPSSDGSYLAAVGEKGTVVLFDAKKSRLLRRLKGHDTKNNIRSVVFHPKDNWFASAGDDKQIIFWSLSKILENRNASNQIEVEDFILNKKKTPDKVKALAVSPDGKYLASGGGNKKKGDKKITLWDVEDIGMIRKLHTFIGHKERISDLAFSPNGELLASASYDDTARLWQIQTHQKLHTLKGHSDNVQRVAFSADGKKLATSSKDTTIRLWQVDSGKTEYILFGHKKTVVGIDFTADGRYLVSASNDRTLRLWNTQYGTTLRVLQGHIAGINGIAVSQGDVFSASDDRTVKRWEVSLPQQQTVEVSGEPVSVATAPDGNNVAVGFAEGALRLYPLSSKLESNFLWEQPTAHGKNEKNKNNKKVKRLVFSSDSTLLASAGFDKTVKVWQVKEGRLQQTLRGHTGKISAVAFSPDNHTIATASYDGQIGLFTVGTEQKRFYKAHEGEEVNAVSFNKDGTQLLSTSDHGVRLWEFNNDTLTLLEEYLQTKGMLMWSTFSPNDDQIASVGRDQKVHIYSTKSKETLYDLSGHENTIYRVIYSPEGKQVVTISSDASLRLWDLHDQGSGLFTLRLPAQEGGKQWDFDFSCTPTKGCWMAVPLKHSKLVLYQLGDIYQEREKSTLRLAVNKEQFIPLTGYRMGPYASTGNAVLNGTIDYMKMLNERDGGINGIKLVWEECETAYEVDYATRCYEKLKHQGATGAAVFNFQNTNATYAMLERSRNDKIPILSIAFGRSDSIDGRVFGYAFPLLTTYWNQNTTKIKFIGEQEGGLDNLKGKIIANVYHHSDYGKETIPILAKQSKKYGFIVKYFPITPPGNEQRSTWDQIERLKPDWIILRGWGKMNPVALKEAKRIGFPTHRIIGVWWSGSEEDVIPAGDAAKGLITTNFHAVRDNFKVIQDIQDYVKDKKPVKEEYINSIYYKRGIITGILSTEAIRIAQEEFGHQPLTGEQVRWGLEHLNITEERLKELGAEGLFSPIKTSCTNHEGGGKVLFQQWDGEKWVIISDWIEPDYDMTRPLVEESTKKYVEEKGIRPRSDCTQEE